MRLSVERLSGPCARTGKAHGRRRRTHGAADAQAGRRETTASRRIRPADASQAPDGEKRPCAGDRDERAGRESATNPRGSAAGFRKTRARPTRGRVDAAATGGRRQSADCRAPAAQGATRARARAATAGNRTRLSATHTTTRVPRLPPRRIPLSACHRVPRFGKIYAP